MPSSSGGGESLEIAPALRIALGSLILVLLLVPVRIGAAKGVDLSLAFVTFGFAVPFLVLLPQTWGGSHLILAFGCSLASVLIGLISARSPSLRPLFSFAYFWLSFLLFPVGWWLVRTEKDLAILIHRGAAISAFVGLVITVPLLATGTPVRTEGSLGGSLAGLPLYASFGVNSLATIYALQWCLIVVDLCFGKLMSMTSVLFRLVGMVSLSYLLIFSLSRGSIGGCVAFALVVMVFLLRYRTRLGLAALSLTLLLSGYAAIQYGEAISLAWDYKLNARREGVSAADQATAGRSTLYMAALKDLESHPFIGTAFSGFLDHPGATRELGDEVSSSPHNEYLMIVWKMGLVAGAVYLTLLFRIVMRATSGVRVTERRVSVGMLLMLLSLMATSFMVWDALLVPNVGALFLFFLGGLAAISTRQQRNFGPTLSI